MPESSSRAHRIGDRTADDRFNRVALDRRLTREPIGFHVTIRLEASRRVVARVVLEQGEARGLLAFGAADDHLHAALATDRASAGAFARYVESALVWQLGLAARFERARIRPLQDQKHAYNTFHYAHRQDSRHLLDLDRAREGTSLPDLLGLRVLETSLIARVRAHLPRIRREDLIGQFPPHALDLDPPLDLDVLADAAAAALALVDLRGRSPDAFRARRAAVQAAGPDVPSRRLSDCLGIGLRAIQSLRNQQSEPILIGAVERQAHLRSVVRAAALVQRSTPCVVLRRAASDIRTKPSGRPQPPSQTWGTFIRNHLAGTLAIDFFTVPTVTFDILYVFVVLSLERRINFHVNVTAHPYADWAAQQIVEPIRRPATAARRPAAPTTGPRDRASSSYAPSLARHQAHRGLPNTRARDRSTENVLEESLAARLAPRKGGTWTKDGQCLV